MLGYIRRLMETLRRYMRRCAEVSSENDDFSGPREDSPRKITDRGERRDRELDRRTRVVERLCGARRRVGPTPTLLAGEASWLRQEIIAQHVVQVLLQCRLRIDSQQEALPREITDRVLQQGKVGLGIAIALFDGQTGITACQSVGFGFQERNGLARSCAPIVALRSRAERPTRIRRERNGDVRQTDAAALVPVFVDLRHEQRQ